MLMLGGACLVVNDLQRLFPAHSLALGPAIKIGGNAKRGVEEGLTAAQEKQAAMAGVGR